jgi:23S rRNA (uridine2552-2'-O)-methyltransferase
VNGVTKKWLRERELDYYYRLAKVKGYRSRAAFKLLQVSEKYDLIDEGDTVVDLGAAPGGWLQAARTIVGESGFVLGIDLKPIDNLQWSNVAFLVGNIKEFEDLKISERLPRGQADVVLSDVAPNISGVWEVDHSRQIDLAETSLKIASVILRKGGNFLVKAFQGELLEGFVKEAKTFFSVVKIVKPRASRAKSSEVYILGLNYILD